MSVFISFSCYFWKQWDTQKKNQRQQIAIHCGEISVWFEVDSVLFWMRFYYVESTRKKLHEMQQWILFAIELRSLWLQQNNKVLIRSNNMDSSFAYHFICNNLPHSALQFQFQLESNATVNFYFVANDENAAINKSICHPTVSNSIKSF